MGKKPWPKHPDGRNKKMGEMTKEEQLEQAAQAVDRLNKELGGKGIKVKFGGEYKRPKISHD